MQKSLFKISALTIVLSCFFACKPKLDAPDAGKGNLNVSKYVALGNSITAGYADNALYYDGQQASYANLFAEQLKLIGGGDFKIPLMDMSSVGVGSAGNSRLNLSYKQDCKGNVGLTPLSTNGDVLGLITSVSAQAPFNNMGVPGAKVVTAIYPGYGDPSKGFGNYNPFFARMLSENDNKTASMLSKCAEQKPTFFSVFIGNNDVLGYASSGGVGDVITPSAGAPGIGFDESYDLIISTLTADGAQGVVANIPDITNLPFFTTVPYNGLLLDEAKAEQLNKYYEFAGITFTVGYNAFIIKDPTIVAFLGLRQMKPTELVLLSIPQDSIKCADWGGIKPIENKYILTEPEIAKVKAAVGNYNNKIKAIANDKGLAHVDVNDFMAKTKKGMVYNAVNINTTFVSGGAFSLDGVHLTPLGNAALANEFIKAVNERYQATIPLLEITKYKGVSFP